VETGETYRLGAADLEFGELLPVKPGWLAQEDDDERTRIGFSLERMVRGVDGLAGAACGWLRRPDPTDDAGDAATRAMASRKSRSSEPRGSTPAAGQK
jgi:hypothetical protein